MPLKNTWGKLITDDEADDSAAASTFLGEKPFAPGQNSTSYIAEFIEVRR